MIKRYSILFLAFSFLLSCSDATTDTKDETTTDTTNTTTNLPPKVEGTPTTIKGTIEGLEDNQKIFFDKKTLDATDVVGTTTLDANGVFELNTGIKVPGIYRVRLGARPVWMLLKGGEHVEITAKMDGYKIAEYTLTGGLHAEEMKQWNDNDSDTKSAEISKYLAASTQAKPLLDLFLVSQLDLAANIKIYQKVLNGLIAAFPNDTYTKQFNSKVMSMVAKINSMPVAVGAEAPEINLPNPNGKKMALSSLRGKVVLLDFWASWCRPCRMTNPHVVELYKKYNKKGFDIFNVSLDGIDDKRAAMYQNNTETIAKATELERGKWKSAIKADKLTWKNHVSELRSWSSPVAALYGVNSIPKTFLLDKKGIIRYENLRGQALENALKTLLAE
jgi:thiol-disulfide isomerase/thioredoxin